jgi:prepilin signal peptidase PulO-like enzyme (type II secretory pathway)
MNEVNNIEPIGMNRQTKERLIKFVVYMTAGFLVAFLYHQFEN